MSTAPSQAQERPDPVEVRSLFVRYASPVRPLTEDEKNWNWNQARLRRSLDLMSLERWRDYVRQWTAKNGPPGAGKNTLAINKYVRRS